jgi:voltage-gated potassium channel
VSILSYILRLWELPYEQDMVNSATRANSNNLQDYGSSIWLTCITMTTVGYGDIYPHTIGGQITAIVIALWGTFVISLLIMITSNVFEHTETER